MGLAYWVLYLLLFDTSPLVFCVSELSWTASYIFLALRLYADIPKEKHKEKAVFWILPVFSLVMGVFFCTRGSYFENILMGTAMGVLGFYAVKGICFAKNGKFADKKLIFAAALAMALPDGIYMPFAQNYNAIKPALDKLKSEPGYDVICRLGAEFEVAAAQIGPGKTRLSPREREVAELIRQGFTNKQIAARLYVSVSTVKMTISNIFDKTGIRSRAQLPDAKI